MFAERTVNIVRETSNYKYLLIIDGIREFNENRKLGRGCYVVVKQNADVKGKSIVQESRCSFLYCNAYRVRQYTKNKADRYFVCHFQKKMDVR